MNTEPRIAQNAMQVATEQRAPASGVLLDAGELAVRLNMPETWIREKCRNRALLRDADPLPHLKLGKYLRFRWSDVEAWLARQGA